MSNATADSVPLVVARLPGVLIDLFPG
ncbi:MAG: MoaD/ThiS family protein, partial [Mesorhizobium sp.]